MPEHIRVLISYSHGSDAHRERIRDLVARLRADGVDAWSDQFSPPSVEGWPRWIEREFVRAKFAVVACTEPHAERFNRGDQRRFGGGDAVHRMTHMLVHVPASWACIAARLASETGT